jgi:serine protease AprX
VKKSGTSMATPIVSGAAALLLQKYPYMNNEQVKRKMVYSARDLGEAWNKQGWGMLDIQRLFE